MTGRSNQDGAPFLQLEECVFDSPVPGGSVSFSLNRGQLGYLRRFSIAFQLLGIDPVISGEVRIEGRHWEEMPVAKVEDARMKIGVVFDPQRPQTAQWISNLDVDENIYLCSSFEAKRSHKVIVGKADGLARKFGLDSGLPRVRPTKASPQDLIRAQWVRALLPVWQDLLILENPLDYAPRASVEPFVEELNRIMEKGTAILWVSRSVPPFKDLGMKPDVLWDER